ncbi:MAG: hypothetical protein RMX96_11075 [Nostoc sp. ChiSLP02]|nr:hypothetical protein [Nostoc sp. ChiSLP02]
MEKPPLQILSDETFLETEPPVVTVLLSRRQETEGRRTAVATTGETPVTRCLQKVKSSRVKGFTALDFTFNYVRLLIRLGL